MDREDLRDPRKECAAAHARIGARNRPKETVRRRATRTTEEMTSGGLGIDGDELERLIESGEGPRTEFEEAPRGNAPERIREAVRAFANDLSGSGLPGLVAVGPRDDGRPSGFSADDGALRQPTDIRGDGNILPPPTISVEKRLFKNVEIPVVLVAPSDSPPVRFKGSMHARAGPRRAVATAQEERVLNEKGASTRPSTYMERPGRESPTSTACASRASICRAPSTGTCWRRTSAAWRSAWRRPR